jgi:hypothetical protein
MPLANGAVNYTIFADPGVSFTINITFGDFSSSYTWVRDKVNLYAFIKLQRENDFRQEHITA